MLILEPKEDSTQHRKLINLFQTMINEPIVKTKIIEAKDSNDIIDIIKNWESIQMDDDLI